MELVHGTRVQIYSNTTVPGLIQYNAVRDLLLPYFWDVLRLAFANFVRCQNTDITGRGQSQRRSNLVARYVHSYVTIITGGATARPPAACIIDIDLSRASIRVGILPALTSPLQDGRHSSDRTNRNL